MKFKMNYNNKNKMSDFKINYLLDRLMLDDDFNKPFQKSLENIMKYRGNQVNLNFAESFETIRNIG